MKIGYDEITQAVRLNDATADGAGQSIGDMAASFDVDVEALTHVALQRSSMAIPLVGRSEARASEAALGAIWFDGFFAAMHVLEQQGDLDKVK